VEKTTDLSQTNFFTHNGVSSTPRLSGVQTHNFSGDLLPLKAKKDYKKE
jgi:hypothetical protein